MYSKNNWNAVEEMKKLQIILLFGKMQQWNIYDLLSKEILYLHLQGVWSLAHQTNLQYAKRLIHDDHQSCYLTKIQLGDRRNKISRTIEKEKRKQNINIHCCHSQLSYLRIKTCNIQFNPKKLLKMAKTYHQVN